MYKHSEDYATGFGGKHGVQRDHQDKSSYGWDEHTALAKHGSQTGSILDVL